MTSEPDLVDRVRAVLADRSTLREVNMFGGLAFMVDDRMLVSVGRSGDDLLVRVDPADDHRLVTRPGARRAEMGTGRSMGDGWICVASDAIESDDTLEHWMEVALDFHARALDKPR